MIRFACIFSLLFLLSCGHTGKKANPQAPLLSEMDRLEPDHDTLPNGKRHLDNLDMGTILYYKEQVGPDTLRGGYIVCYGIDDSTAYHYLRHGDTLYLLNKAPIPTSLWGLGTLEEDFGTFFMTHIDNGNSTPSSYQLFDKKTGKNILGDGIWAVNYTYLNDTLFMLYQNPDSNQKNGDIILINAKTKTKEYYKFPNELPDFLDIQIDTLTKDILKLTYSAYIGDYTEKTEIYKR